MGQPGHPRAHERLVLPGNQRLRAFDFGRGTTRVHLKQGFDAASIRTEVAVRGGGRQGPFPQITRSDPEGTWFEEPIVQGFVLSRCPPWKPRARYEAEGLRLLEEWLTASEKTADVAPYVASVHARFAELCDAFAERYPDEPRALGRAGEVLAARANTLDKLTLAHSHGDFQPGNLLVEQRTDRVFLTDWEYSARRSRRFDHLVHELRLRSAVGLATRVRSYGGDRAEGALALLEELVRLLEENLSGCYIAPSVAYRCMTRELPGVIEELGTS